MKEETERRKDGKTERRKDGKTERRKKRRGKYEIDRERVKERERERENNSQNVFFFVSFIVDENPNLRFRYRRTHLKP